MPQIKVDYTKCNGCRLCEIACSLHHIENTFNPKRSRIRVFALGDSYYPVIAGLEIVYECASKNTIVIDGKEYDGCTLCRASCLVKEPIFMEPQRKPIHTYLEPIPLKCDLCGDPPKPQCVEICLPNALTLIEEEQPQNVTAQAGGEASA